MAVNIILGAPGGGKSYEAVAFHVLPALAKGRKVITNLPLVLDEFAAIDSSFVDLIELRQKTLAEPKEVDWEKAQSMFQKFGIAARQDYFNPSAFSHAEDYGDAWRHPDDGSGPLYVIDECHIALPSRNTPRGVEEWFSLHRHESADVLLISQSHSKINRSVIDLVQICYRVRKNTALGSDKTYRRFVFDGVRGAEVNFAVRKYESRFFKLYKSHTRGGGAELQSQDITPLWKRPVIVAAGIAIVIAAIFVARSGNPLSPKVAIPSSTSVAQGPDAKVVKAAGKPATDDHSLGQYQVHQVGDIKYSDGRVKTFFRLSKNGAVIFEVDSHQLAELGYTVTRLAKCFSHIQNDAGWSQYVSCDSPSQGFGLPQPSGPAGEGPAKAGEVPAVSPAPAPSPAPITRTS